MDQYEEFKKHYIAAKVEYLKAHARCDYFQAVHTAKLDDNEENAAARLDALWLEVRLRECEAVRIFRHMAKVIGDFDSIIDKDLCCAGRFKIHANALVDVSVGCDQAGSYCRVHIYIMKPRAYYVKLLKDVAKKHDCDLYFPLYNYVNSQGCDDVFKLIDELNDVDKEGAYVEQIIEYMPDNDVLNGDRGFLKRYIDDVIRKYYLDERDNKRTDK